MPAASWPPKPPKLPSRLAFLLAHRRCASRSAYVNPTTLERLNTSASRTIGRNLTSAVYRTRKAYETLNLRKETISSAVQPRGYAYRAIQNILHGQLAYQQTSSLYSLGVNRVRGTALRLPTSVVCSECVTHVSRLEDPGTLALLVDLVPIPQSDERAPSDVASVPEVEREQDDNDDDLGSVRFAIRNCYSCAHWHGASTHRENVVVGD